MPDSIFIFKNYSGDLLFEYKVEKGNTVYSIARFFKVDIMQIYGFNSRLQNQALDINSKLVIPFNIELLKNEYNSNIKPIKVFYRVGNKENLFRISKIYFHKSVDELYKRNNLKNFIIKPGQLLYIGNIYRSNVDFEKESTNKKISGNNNKQEHKKIVEKKEVNTGVKKEKPVFVKKVIVGDTVGDKKDVIEENTKSVDVGSEINDSTSEVFVKEKKCEDNGLAIWNKNLSINGVFVLNNEAKLYTFMELYNPLVNKTILAKVIGRIPDNTYSDNVKLILSPEAARLLRALDQRFFVRYKYLK